MWMNSRRSPRVVLQGAWACRLTDLGAVPDLQAAANGLLELTCYHVHRCTGVNPVFWASVPCNRCHSATSHGAQNHPHVIPDESPRSHPS